MPEFRFHGEVDGEPSALKPGDARVGAALAAAPVPVEGEVKTVAAALGGALQKDKLPQQPVAGRLLRDWFSDDINFKALGAPGDGVTDATAYLEDALGNASLKADRFFLNGGKFRFVRPLTLDISKRLEGGRTPNFQAAGPSSAQLFYDGPDGPLAALTIVGDPAINGDFGAYLRHRLGGFTITTGGKQQAVGLSLNKLAFADFDPIYVEGFGLGFALTDVVSCSFSKWEAKYNRAGMRVFPPTTFSNGNALTFYAPVIGLNGLYGAQIEAASCISIVGGSVEANGGEAGGFGFGLQMLNSGGGGGAALSMMGTYVEGNRGLADIMLIAGEYPSTYSMAGVTFNRPDSTYFATHNVRVETSANSGHVKLDMRACAHRSYSDYQPLASRRYIQHYGPSNKFTFSDSSPIYNSPVEAPGLLSARVIARARFDGTVASGQVAPVSSFGVANISKDATGTYTITLLDSTGNATKTPVVSTNAPVTVQTFGESASQVAIRLFDRNDALRDASIISVAIFDG